MQNFPSAACKTDIFILLLVCEYYRLEHSHRQSNKESVMAIFLSRFPNLSIGNLSRDSVRQALTRGITAEQVSWLWHYKGTLVREILEKLYFDQTFQISHKCFIIIWFLLNHDMKFTCIFHLPRLELFAVPDLWKAD